MSSQKRMTDKVDDTLMCWESQTRAISVCLMVKLYDTVIVSGSEVMLLELNDDLAILFNISR